MRHQQAVFTLLTSLCIFFIALPAYALLSAPMGWYLEGNLGSTHLSNTNFNGSTSSSGVGGNGNLGYKFMPFFGLELGYSQYANTSIKTNNGTKAASVKYYSYDLAARGILPIVDSGVELFAKAGIQRLNAHYSIQNNLAATSLGLTNTHHSTTGPYYGAGGQYYFMPELAAVIQWQRAQGTSTTGTMDLYSVGLSFIFD